MIVPNTRIEILRATEQQSGDREPRLLKILMSNMFGGDPALLVSHLVSDHPLSAEELRKLHATLSERLADEAPAGRASALKATRRRKGGQ